MSLVAIGGAPIPVGLPVRSGLFATSTLSSVLLDAANEACIMVGRVMTGDGGSHTIDTTGSSSLEWRTGAVTFANAGSTCKVGLAEVDLANGPPVRAANVADVVTLDVSASFTGGGGGVTTLAWQTHVPTAGTKTIAHGDLVAFVVQLTARGGADAVNVGVAPGGGTTNRPSVTNFLGAAYANGSQIPNVIITFSDGTLGWFLGSYVASSGSSTQTWNNGSATKEYGNLFQFPFPVRVYGILAVVAPAGNFDLNGYSDPLGTPVAQRTVSIDLNAVAGAAVNNFFELFTSPYDLAANAPFAAIATPTSVTSIDMAYLTLNASSHQVAFPLGTNCYAINRASGAFAAQNSNKDRFAIGLLVGGFDAGASASPTLMLGV